MRELLYFCRMLILATSTLLQGTQFNLAIAQETNLTGTLVIHLQGLVSNEGKLRFALFDSDKDFMKTPVRSGIVDIVGQKGVWIVEDLPYGTYAILVHHDINGNGMMEKNWLGIPKEPTGVSNGTPAGFGPPRFDDAKFQFEPSTELLIISM